MAPRRIVTFNWVTADGYFAGADRNLDWIVPDEEQARVAAEGISGVDTVLYRAGAGRASSGPGAGLRHRGIRVSWRHELALGRRPSS